MVIEIGFDIDDILLGVQSTTYELEDEEGDIEYRHCFVIGLLLFSIIIYF